MSFQGEKQSAVIAALCEGVSIRATERLTGIHRDTIMRLGVKVGEGCAVLHGRLMSGLHVSRIELDEVWSFVKKKRRNVAETILIRSATNSSTWRWTAPARRSCPGWWGSAACATPSP